MKKGVLLAAVVISMLIILSLSSVYAFSLRDFFNRIAGKATIVTNITCTDSDGGIDYNVKGTITRCVGASCSNNSDSCSGIYGLSERYCKNNYYVTKTYRCPNGCRDGACIASGNQSSVGNAPNATEPALNVTITTNCTDTDEGKNYAVKGKACVNERCSDDSCFIGRYNIERYCDKENIRTEFHRCSGSCKEGACV